MPKEGGDGLRRGFIKGELMKIVSITASVASPPAWKWFVAASAALLAQLHPTEGVRTAVITCLCLLAVDTVLGIYAAITTGEPIKSAKFSRVLAKSFVYLFFPAVAFYALKAVALGDLSAAAATAIAMLAVTTEFISIIENIERSKLMPIPEWLTAIVKGRLQELQEKPKTHEAK